MDQPLESAKRHITFVRPTATLPVSLTGEHCALDCAHCGGHYLKHMATLASVSVSDSAHTSLLISGGCDPQGRVPLGDHRERLQQLHGTHRLNWHVGLAERADMERIAGLTDIISFDIVGDSAVVKEVYGLDLSLADYMSALRLLRQYATVIPHITIGLRGGQPSGEIEAIEALAAADVDSLVLIILIPTHGTRYAHCQPPELDTVRDVMAAARKKLPDAHIALGCMRPHGAYRRAVDEIALHEGLDLIVNPSHAVQMLARNDAYEITWGDECCAFHLQ